MYNFKAFLQELSSNSGIPFILIWEDGRSIFQSGQKPKEIDVLETSVTFGKQRAKLVIDSKYAVCTSLIKYYIENKYKELFSMREQILIDIIEGKSVSSDKVDKNFPFISNGCNLILISVDGSRYEALNIVKQIYNEQDILSMLYDDNIVLIGSFDEADEHAESIREAIISNLYCRCYVSFSKRTVNASEIREAYNNAKESLYIGRKLGIKSEIYDYDNMIFEKAIYNISPEVKEEFLKQFKHKFDAFDSEMINTIEEFMNSGLNISDAAKKLYIHRNTLIYRLDKIVKDTGYDIRDFKQANIFIIAFLIWKESR